MYINKILTYFSGSPIYKLTVYIFFWFQPPRYHVGLASGPSAERHEFEPCRRFFQRLKYGICFSLAWRCLTHSLEVYIRRTGTYNGWPVSLGHEKDPIVAQPRYATGRILRHSLINEMIYRLLSCGRQQLLNVVFSQQIFLHESRIGFHKIIPSTNLTFVEWLLRNVTTIINKIDIWDNYWHSQQVHTMMASPIPGE